MMLGLALGETLGGARGRPPSDGPLPAGVSTQLACFTAKAIIRAQVRGHHKGICHAPGVLLHAYCRWAFLQGIEPERMARRWGFPGNSAWSDGWLAGVPALARRRGSAPATVAALSRIEWGEERMATPSRGCHALTRTLPVAATGPGGVAQAAALAALTHGDEAARTATVHAATLTHHCLTRAGPAIQALREGVTATDRPELDAALRQAAAPESSITYLRTRRERLDHHLPHLDHHVPHRDPAMAAARPS